MLLVDSAAGWACQCLTDTSWQAEPEQENKKQRKQRCAVSYMSWADSALEALLKTKPRDILLISVYA